MPTLPEQEIPPQSAPVHDSYTAAARAVLSQTGIVIPVYFPVEGDNAVGYRLLRETVAACKAHMADATCLCLSVDGEAHGREIAEELANVHGVQVCVAERNRGKLQGVRNGMQRLYENEDLRYLGIVDSDGDHFANEIVNLVRTAQYFCAHVGAGEVLVIGERTTRHRPMGFLRGELEEVADRVMMDMLAYHAVVEGQPLRLEGVTTFGEYPDFHSGFKLYTRGAAAATFLGEPQLCGASEDAYFRHGCESVMSIEPLLAGAVLALARRSTFNEQPVSTFGLLDRDRMVADKIIWPAKRRGIPLPFLDQWLRNHLPRLLLNTLAPQGQEELVTIRRLILDEFEGGQALGDDLVRPLFL